MIKRYWVGAAVGLLLGSTAHAVPVTGSQTLNFQAGKQSLWGPGGVAASFETSGSVGNSTLGFSYDIKASSGTVEQARFQGLLDYAYEDFQKRDATDLINFDFTGLTNGGLIDTLFGASLETKYRLLGGTACIYCAGASLDIDQAFTPELDTPFSGSDTATPATAAVGPDVGVGGASAGVDIDVTQTSTLTGKGISGVISAVNQRTGDTKTLSLDLADAGSVALDLGLDRTGVWSVSITDLVLDNEFFSSFGVSLVPFVEYYLGFNCGDDLGSDSDNGFGCVADDRADWNLANLSLGSTDKFSLSFNKLNLAAFDITVVPEPGTLSLLGAGMLALGMLRRRRAPRRG